MTTLAAFSWLLVLLGLGSLGGRRARHWSPGYRLLCAWVLGSAVAGVSFLILSRLGQFGQTQVAMVTGLLTLLSLFGWVRFLSTPSPSPFTQWREYWRGLDQWDRLCFWLIGLCLFVLWLDAATPPRNGDAMRYHLAQMEDMARHGGFVYRPYYHYNFPSYYAYLTTPLYFFSGGLAVKLFNFFVAGVVAAITYGLGRAAGIRRPLIPVLGLLLTPGIIRAAATVGNDLAVLAFALAGILLLHRSIKVRDQSLIPMAYVALGFAVGVKYQSLLFLPWYLWLTWVALERRIDGSGLWKLMLAGGIALLLPAPFFLRNYLNTGDPVWPLQLDLFGVERDYLYEITRRYSNSMTGRHSWSTAWKAFVQLITSGAVIPTVTAFAFLGIGGLIYRWRDKTHLYLAFGVLSQIFLWWIIQPTLYPRFWNYLIPQFMVAALIAYEMLKKLWLRRLALLAAAATVTLSVIVLAIYSISLFRYHLDGDLEAYHDYTWFYDEYAWMDENLPDQAQVLVVVLSGHTYYMPRDYLRADPLYSGLLDWRELDDQGVYDAMEELNLDYVFYQDHDWSNAIGGEETMETMARFASRDDVRLVWERDISLGLSRMRNQKSETTVWLLERLPREPDE
ncbi:MAG: hypothetical protein VX252_09915 [Myxococcota bacterium]|nr:hypothetical protein [Myxococcota bacterium]